MLPREDVAEAAWTLLGATLLTSLAWMLVNL